MFKLRYFICIFVLILFSSCSVFIPSGHYTLKENITIMRCNTARIAPYLSGRNKQIIRLCNLARVNPELLLKYSHKRYKRDTTNLRKLDHLNFHKPKNIYLLRPSFLLTLNAQIHAVGSGLTGYEGHRGALNRLYLTLNFNSALPGIYSGENCIYGSFMPFDAFTGWMTSPGHRKNILLPKYYRIGMGGFFHFSKYRYNMVQVFTGPKIIDLLIRPQTLLKMNKKSR